MVVLIVFSCTMTLEASAQMLPYGSETKVNTTTVGNQSDPAVAMDKMAERSMDCARKMLVFKIQDSL